MTNETIPTDNVQTNYNENIAKALEKLPIRIRCIAKIVLCKCGCGKTRLDRDERGNLREYIHGHHNQFQQSGPLDSQWKGDAASRRTLHQRVRRHKPEPPFCELCKTKPSHDLANISGKYLSYLNDWVFLCRGCHQRSDGRLDALMKAGNRFEPGHKINVGRKQTEECKEKRRLKTLGTTRPSMKGRKTRLGIKHTEETKKGLKLAHQNCKCPHHVKARNHKQNGAPNSQKTTYTIYPANR
ncbi:MAG: hypothetical protein WA364_25990 [Candidatus Nitrosopolaris sp.]